LQANAGFARSRKVAALQAPTNSEFEVEIRM